MTTTQRRRGGPGNDPLRRLSGKMSMVLRHRIKENGLSGVLRPDGYVPLNALMATSFFRSVSVEDVMSVVAKDEKQRYSLLEEDGKMYIRANQGHSAAGIDPEQLLEKLDEEAASALGGGRGQVVHGTTHAAWPAIVASGGLHRMSRQHIHLAEGMLGEANVISGMRRSSEVYVWVDVRRAMHAGATFYRSQNGVILTTGRASDGRLPLEAISRVLDSSGRAWVDGQWQTNAAAATCGETAQIHVQQGGRTGKDKARAKLTKKLGEIAALRTARDEGAVLDKNQVEKIGREDALRSELAELESVD